MLGIILHFLKKKSYTPIHLESISRKAGGDSRFFIAREKTFPSFGQRSNVAGRILLNS